MGFGSFIYFDDMVLGFGVKVFFNYLTGIPNTILFYLLHAYLKYFSACLVLSFVLSFLAAQSKPKRILG